jgi:hypothetical protein
MTSYFGKDFDPFTLFQSTCHDAKGSGKAEKLFLKHDAPFFPSGFTQKQVFGTITHGLSKILFRRACQGFQRACLDAKGSGEAEKTVFWTWHGLVSNLFYLESHLLREY